MSEQSANQEISDAQNSFFVIGSGRSGTTVLRLMLNMHSQIRVPRESGFLIPLILALPGEGELTSRQLQQAYDIVRSHPRWPDWECADGDLRAAIFDSPGSSLGKLIDRIYRRCSGMGSKSRWGDKTPKHSLYVPQLKDIFPGGKFIHVIRDARDVYVSMRNAGWFEKSARRISKYWTGMTIDAMKGRDLGAGRYLEIHYEDMVRNPEEQLRRICFFLDVDFETPMLNFNETAGQEIAPWEKSLHTKTTHPVEVDRIGCWRKEMTWWELLILEAYASPTMRKVGQSPALPCWLRPLSRVTKALLEMRFALGILWEKMRKRVAGVFAR